MILSKSNTNNFNNCSFSDNGWHEWFLFFSSFGGLIPIPIHSPSFVFLEIMKAYQVILIPRYIGPSYRFN
ncbi:hypothetical protein ACB092_11G109200 [Castanea dentata]